MDFSFALTFLVIVAMLFIPWFLLGKQSSWKAIGWLSPAFWAYAIGIILGNLLPLKLSLLEPVQNLTVALGIPLLLFSSNIRQWIRLALPTLISVAVWIPVVMLVCFAASRLFASWFEEIQIMSAMASSVMVGGSPNLYAVHHALNADLQLFNQLNLADLMFGGGYLLLVLTLMPALLRWWLPAFRSNGEEMGEERRSVIQGKGILLSILAALVVLGLSAGISWLLAGGEMGQIFNMWIIILLAVLGLLASLWRPLRKIPESYPTGDYAFLIFCLAVGASVNLADLLGQAPYMFVFMTAIGLSAMLIHSLLMRLFQVDADTALITQVAGIMGPPFIGPVAEKLDNREIVVSGITLGAINLALGNLIGLWEFSLVS